MRDPSFGSSGAPDGNSAYAALREQVHEALAAQHPEWREADGGSPMLDLYDARFAELLKMLQPRGDRRSTAWLPQRVNTRSAIRCLPWVVSLRSERIRKR